MAEFWEYFSVKMLSYQYESSHNKDKTVSWPSHFYNVNP